MIAILRVSSCYGFLLRSRSAASTIREGDCSITKLPPMPRVELAEKAAVCGYEPTVTFTRECEVGTGARVGASPLIVNAVVFHCSAPRPGGRPAKGSKLFFAEVYLRFFHMRQFMSASDLYQSH